GPFDEYDSEFETEDFIRPHCGEEGGPKRGSRGSKRLISRGGGRGLIKKRPQMGLKKSIGAMGKKLGNKRQQRIGKPQQGPQQASDSICSFFMQGKCQKENECPYSHNALPPRKMELCKFYLMGCCAKKDKCLYMHSDFPCKYFHSGMKCAAGNRCKFSHGTLTEPLKEILLKHIETAPKEILGDFPRERAAAMIYNKNCGNKGPWPGTKKIPSLLEIEVPIPPQLLASNPELRREEEKSMMRHSTPKSSSDNEDKEGCRMPNSGPGDEDIRHKGFHKMRGRMLPNREIDEEEEEMPRRPNYQDQDFSEQLQQFKMLFEKEAQNSAEEVEENPESQHQQRKHHRHSKKKKKKSRDEEQTKHSKTHLSYFPKSSPSTIIYPNESMEASLVESKSDGENAELTDEEGKLEIDVEQEDENDFSQTTTEKEKEVEMTKEQNESDNNSSSCSTEMGGLPLNLPKKQRELFLRIQQQQRKTEELNSQDQSGKEEEKDMDSEQQEENWYSSDEEEASLADVLKNLSKQEMKEQKEQQQLRQPSPSTTPPLPPPKSTAILDGIKLSEINISEPVSKLLSIIQQTTSSSNLGQMNISQSHLSADTIDSRASSTQSVMAKELVTGTRDPRLALGDQNKRSTSISSLSPNAQESPRQDPRISKRSSQKSQSHRTSIYSSVVNPLSSNITQTGSEIESKNYHVSQQQVNTSFELGTDMDPRTRPSTSASQYPLGDLEDVGNIDMKGALGLPFKPVPMHKPATEIDASLTSHPPIQYKVIPVSIPWPDYSRLKLNVRSDPRLRKLFKVSSSSSKRQSSPPPPPPPSSPPPFPKQSPSAARNDPRRRSAPMSPHSTSSPRIQDTPPVYSDMMSPNPMGMAQNSMSLVQNQMNINQNPMGGGQNPLGLGQNPIGMNQNPMGMNQNPMGMNQNPMGMNQNPMGMNQNPMGLMQNTGMPSGMGPSMPPGLGFDPRLPRNPRNAPGLLGPAPLPMNFCPNTPKYDEMDEGGGPNPDVRMFYNQQSMDMQPSHSRNQNMPRNRTWKNSRKNRRFRPQQHEQKRSYTPPR
ncbi:hypothetical protein L9F63_000176, partial [Diploptera punctata]